MPENMVNLRFETVDAYIETFPGPVQKVLTEVRQTILNNAPEAMEGIAYGMPGYKFNKRPLVYFAGHAKHIGFYALPSGHERFEQELSRYKRGKGSVQFPLDQPMPLDLIAEIVRFRVQENERS